MARIFELDAYSPSEIAEKVQSVGVAKARLTTLQTLMLGAIAGGFIGLGALYSTLVISDPQLSFGVARVLGGVAFSLGLILVVVAGAELFTGNNLLVMAWADRKITTLELLRNWFLVYVANAVGAIGLAILVYLSHLADMNQGAVGLAYVKIATAKTALPLAEAIYKGVLCNLLVCLAVWLALAGHTVTDKVLAIVFPISAFVAAGFEHCVANMYFIPLGILLKDSVTAPAGLDMTTLDWPHFIGNLVPVTLGNIFGGSVMVALVYYIIYRREPKTDPARTLRAKRQCTRFPHDGKPLDAAELRMLELAGSGASVRCILSTDPARIACVTDYVTHGKVQSDIDAKNLRSTSGVAVFVARATTSMQGD